MNKCINYKQEYLSMYNTCGDIPFFSWIGYPRDEPSYALEQLGYPPEKLSYAPEQPFYPLIKRLNARLIRLSARETEPCARAARLSAHQAAERSID